MHVTLVFVFATTVCIYMYTIGTPRSGDLVLRYLEFGYMIVPCVFFTVAIIRPC